MYYKDFIEKGKKDYYSGVSFEDNPVRHGPSPAMCAWWEKGWNDAKKEDDINKTNSP